MSSTAVLGTTGADTGCERGDLAALRERLCRREMAAQDVFSSAVAGSEVANPASAAALEHAETALDDLFAAGVGPDDSFDSFDAIVWITQLEHLGRRVDAARATLVGAIQRRALHAPDGHGSPKIMIRHVARLSEAEATARSKTATTCRRLPKVVAAWQAGDLPTCAVRVLGRIHANPRVAPAMVGRQDEFIADAQHWSNRGFAAKAYRWARLIDEDGPQPRNDRNHEDRDVHLGQNPWDLSWDLSGFFASAQGAEMREILDRYVDAEFKADWEIARARFGDEVTKADLERTDAQRRADALYRIFQNAASSPDGAMPPGFVHNVHWSASAYEAMLDAMDADHRPRFDPDDFMCRTDTGHDLDPTEAAATSLFSKFRRIVVDANGVVIDLGRARRFTGSARTAATATQTHCIWPGCHAPSNRCDIDHLTEHSRNGPTNQTNAAPLCGRHNRWKQKGFAIRRLPDGTWRITRPNGSQLE